LEQPGLQQHSQSLHEHEQQSQQSTRCEHCVNWVALPLDGNDEQQRQWFLQAC